MKKTLIIFSILIGFLFAENPTLNVQGVLRDETGAAVPDGDNYQLTFYVYEAVEGGSSIWYEDHTGVSVHNGVYSTELGGVSSLGGLAFDGPYYLGISVNGGSESTPRIPLSMSPYALSVRGTTNTFPNDGHVGIGTTDPNGGLDVSAYSTASWSGWHNTINLSTPSHAGIFYEPNGLFLGFHGNGNIYFGDAENSEYRMTISDANITVHNRDLVVAGEVKITATTDADLTNGALEIGNESGESLAIDGNEIQARNNGEPSTLYLNRSGGGWTETGWLQVKGNIQVNNYAPIFIKDYSIGSACDIEYNTGQSVTDYSAVIVGVDEGNFDYNETHSGWSYVCVAYPHNGTWYIKARERCDTAPDWIVHVMFIRKEIVSDQRDIWKW